MFFCIFCIEDKFLFLTHALIKYFTLIVNHFRITYTTLLFSPCLSVLIYILCGSLSICRSIPLQERSRAVAVVFGGLSIGSVLGYVSLTLIILQILWLVQCIFGFPDRDQWLLLFYFRISIM